MYEYRVIPNKFFDVEIDGKIIYLYCPEDYYDDHIDAIHTIMINAIRRISYAKKYVKDQYKDNEEWLIQYYVFDELLSIIAIDKPESIVYNQYFSDYAHEINQVILLSIDYFNIRLTYYSESKNENIPLSTMATSHITNAIVKDIKDNTISIETYMLIEELAHRANNNRVNFIKE